MSNAFGGWQEGELGGISVNKGMQQEVRGGGWRLQGHHKVFSALFHSKWKPPETLSE